MSHAEASKWKRHQRSVQTLPLTNAILSGVVAAHTTLQTVIHISTFAQKEKIVVVQKAIVNCHFET